MASKIAASAMSIATKKTVANVTKRFSSSSAVATKKPKFRYLSAWFCPFAHRATLALEHHSDRVDYEWIEALGWEQREGLVQARPGLCETQRL